MQKIEADNSIRIANPRGKRRGGEKRKKYIDNLKILGHNDIIICDPFHPDAKYKDIKDIPMSGVVSAVNLVIIATPTKDHFEHLHFCNDRKARYIPALQCHDYTLRFHRHPVDIDPFGAQVWSSDPRATLSGMDRMSS